jgi:hypothetical protein
MSQLVHNVILDKEGYHSTSDGDIVYAVGDFVRVLLSNHFRHEELPPIAIQSHYLDYYYCQIQNGNIGQFVTNSRWNPLIVEAIREALKAVNARQHAELFEEVCAFVEGTRRDLEAAVKDGDVIPYWQRANALRGDFYRAFIAAGPEKLSEDLQRMNASWIRTWKNIKLVPNERLMGELDTLVKLIPDLEARQEKARQAVPWYVRRIKEVLAAAGQSLVRLNAGGAIQHDGTIYPCWHISTNAGHHHVVFRDQLAVLYLGSSDEIVSTSPAPEATPDRELAGWEKMAMRRLQS